MENIKPIEQPVIKYETKFSPEFGTLLLAIDKTDIDLESKREQAEKLNLSEKPELHLTVIGSDTGEQILTLLNQKNEANKQEILNQIVTLFQSLNCQITLDPEFYHIQQDYNDPDPVNPHKTIMEKRQSIIQLAKIEGLEQFYQKLNALLKTNFSVPLSHLTLYTTSTRADKKLRGIGIYSREQFAQLNPEKV